MGNDNRTEGSAPERAAVASPFNFAADGKSKHTRGRGRTIRQSRSRGQRIDRTPRTNRETPQRPFLARLRGFLCLHGKIYTTPNDRRAERTKTRPAYYTRTPHTEPRGNGWGGDGERLRPLDIRTRGADGGHMNPQTRVTTHAHAWRLRHANGGEPRPSGVTTHAHAWRLRRGGHPLCGGFLPCCGKPLQVASGWWPDGWPLRPFFVYIHTQARASARVYMPTGARPMCPRSACIPTPPHPPLYIWGGG